METTSKYLGRVFDGFEVVEYYKVNSYINRYGKEKKPTYHNAYNYKLYNHNTHQILELSGNEMRLLNKGTRTISDMLHTNARSSRNKRIREYLKWVRSL